MLLVQSDTKAGELTINYEDGQEDRVTLAHRNFPLFRR